MSSNERGSAADRAKALTSLAYSERNLQHLEAARRHYAEAAEIYRSAGDPLRLAHTIRHVADILQDEAHPDLAEPLYHEALGLYRRNEGTPPLDLANAIRGLAVLKSGTGEAEEARQLWAEARDLYAAVGVEAGVKEASRRLAQL